MAKIEDFHGATIMTDGMAPTGSATDLPTTEESTNIIRPWQSPLTEDQRLALNLNAFEFDDVGNAEVASLLLRGSFIYVHQLGWGRWTGTHYDFVHGGLHIGEAIGYCLRERSRAYLDDCIRRNADIERSKLSQVAAKSPRINATESLLRGRLVVPIDAVDAGEWFLNCPNGVVDLRTGDIEPHDPTRHFFSYVSDTPFNPDADASELKAFLIDVLNGDAGLIEFLQLFMGYSITGSNREEKLLYLHGLRRSGKSTLQQVVASALGAKPLSASVSFDFFTRDRSRDGNNADIASLRAVRLMMVSESDKNTRLRSDLLKQMTAGDTIRVALKHREHFDYTPRFKPVMASNWKPNVDPTDEAAWGRIFLVNFPNSYFGKEDKRLKDRLMSPESRQGVLAWLIAGAVKWYDLPQGIQPPATVEKATADAWADVDEVQQFLDVYTTPDADGHVTHKELYEQYTEFAEENGTFAMKKRNFSQELERKGLKKHRNSAGMIWRGIVMK